MTDSVADFLTRIRNALDADHDEVVVPASRLNQELARVLQEEGYIEGFAIEQTTRPPGLARAQEHDASSRCSTSRSSTPRTASP